MTQCDASLFPSIYLLMNSYWVEISPHDYLVDMSEGPNDHYGCILAFGKSPISMFVLGDSFMRGFYVIHSDENDLLGIVPHANS